MKIMQILAYCLIVLFCSNICLAMEKISAIEKLSDGLYVAQAKHPGTNDTLYFALERISTEEDYQRWLSLKTFSNKSASILDKYKDKYKHLGPKVSDLINRQRSYLNDGHIHRGSLIKNYKNEHVYVAYIRNQKIYKKFSALPEYGAIGDFTEDLLKSSDANGIEMAMGVATAEDLVVQAHIGITRIFSIPRDEIKEQAYFHDRISVMLHSFAALAVSRIASENGETDSSERKMVTVPLDKMGDLLKKSGIAENDVESFNTSILGFDGTKARLLSACKKIDWLSLEWGKNLKAMALDGEFDWVVVNTGALEKLFIKCAILRD